MELLKQQTRTTHVPYRGTAPAVTDLLGTSDQRDAPRSRSPLQACRGGQGRRLPMLLPGVRPLPPLKMGDLEREVEMWYGILAPKGTPRAVIDRLNSVRFKAVLAQPEVKAAFETQGLVPAHSTPDADDLAPRALVATHHVAAASAAVESRDRLGGLAAAASLLQRGHHVRVHEQAPH